MTTAEKLVKILTEKKMTCATAESCTGGGVGYTITGVSGASAVFWGGVISYDNSVKRDVLGVPEEVLATKGAVAALEDGSSGCAYGYCRSGRRHGGEAGGPRLVRACLAVKYRHRNEDIPR